MATTTELGLLSLTHLHNLTTTQQSQHNNQNQNQNPNQNPNPNQDQQDHYYQLLLTNPSTNNIAPTNSTNNNNTTIVTSTTGNSSTSWMWNPRANQAAEPADEDSWEVRAFAEDTGSVMGTTWPPRSYTCAFCRREFRSAQALGGHMNVHRRDRARLHHQFPPSNSAPSSSTLGGGDGAHLSSSSFLIPAAAREFVPSGAAGGLCLLYQFQKPNNTAAGVAARFASCNESPAALSTLLSISPYRPLGNSPAALNFPTCGDGDVRISRREDRQIIRTEELVESTTESSGGEEELDLELRLGHGPTPT